MDNKQISSITQLDSKLLLKRLFSIKPSNEYENLVSIFMNLCYFENEELEGILKKCNFNAYQFIVSSQYFSRTAVDLSNLKDSLLFSFFDKQIEDKVLFSSLRKGKDFLYSISAEKKKSLCGDFEAIENEVSSVFGNDIETIKKIDIHTISTTLTSKISDISSKRKNIFSKINSSSKEIEPLLKLLSLPPSTSDSSFSLKINEDSLLKDMIFENKIYQNWRAYQKRRQETNSISPLKKNIENFKEELKTLTSDDIVCVICNDGDYEENDLIVYCSNCQITVHQNCYGIPNLPDEDWICNICLVYDKEDINNIECCLCSVKGGALKLSQLKKNSSFYKKIKRLRGTMIDIGNEADGEVDVDFDCENNEEEKEKEKEKEKEREKKEGEGIGKCKGKNRKIKTKSIGSIVKKQSNSQLLSISEQYEIYKSQVKKKSNSFVWVHVSCALWNPNIILDDFVNKEDIKKISSFNEECNICNKTGYGPCFKCESKKCKLQFHVECARINKFHLECHSVDEEIKYFIYCQLHRPLQSLKLMEIRNNKKKEEILKYGRYLEKYIYSLMKTKTKNSLYSKIVPVEMSSYKHGLLMKKRKKEVIKNEEADECSQIQMTKSQINKVISKVKEIYNKLVSMDVHLKYKEKTNSFEINKKNLPLVFPFKDIFDKDIFPWYSINFNDITPKMAYNCIGNLCSDEYLFTKIVLGINLNKEKSEENERKASKDCEPTLKNGKNEKRRKEQKKTSSKLNQQNEEEEYNSYCYCQRQYNSTNTYMIACSNESSCLYNGWFHPLCVPELRNLLKEEIENENFSFTCKACKPCKVNEEDGIELERRDREGSNVSELYKKSLNNSNDYEKENENEKKEENNENIDMDMDVNKYQSEVYDVKIIE